MCAGLPVEAEPGFWYFGIGLLLVAAVLFARGGLLGLVEDIVGSSREGDKR